MVNKKEIQSEFINVYDQPADVFTKIVPVEKFQQFKEFLKITNKKGVLNVICNSQCLLLLPFMALALLVFTRL
jgi:hypothetical protein